MNVPDLKQAMLENEEEFNGISKRDYVLVPREQFIEILDKASRFDVLVNDMKRNIDIDPNQYGIIDDRVVYAVTGCASYREEVRKLKAKEKEE